MIKKIINFLKEHGGSITVIVGILVILDMFGFNLNVVDFYRELTAENKILFMSFLNLLLIVIAYFNLVNKINKPKEG